MRRHVYGDGTELEGARKTLDEGHLSDGTISYDDTYNKSINQRDHMDQQAANI
jgi:hypothetical protein